MLKTICHISIYLMTVIPITICVYTAIVYNAIKKTHGVLDLIIAIMIATDISLLIFLAAVMLNLSL